MWHMMVVMANSAASESRGWQYIRFIPLHLVGDETCHIIVYHSIGNGSHYRSFSSQRQFSSPKTPQFKSIISQRDVPHSCLDLQRRIDYDIILVPPRPDCSTNTL